nr:MotE family protein [Methylobacterium sp. Leaf100]
MSSTKALRIAGEAARMVVPGHARTVPSRGLAPMAVRMLVCLGLLAVASLALGPVRAQGSKPEGGKPAVSGLNPGPFPKSTPGKSKLADIKPIDTKLVESKPAEVAPDAVRLPEVAQVAEVRLPEAPAAPEPARSASANATPAKPSPYCASIADAAADARFAWQKEQLAILEKQVDERIRRLEEKRAEYESWLARRNEFLAKADTGVVAIYQKMRPDAAALQLANMPDEGAAAILTKLNARTASAILSEMEAARAAQLARMMTDAGKKARESEKS